MARTKKHHRRGKGVIPLAVLAGFVPLATDTINAAMHQGVEQAGWTFAYGLIGYSGGPTGDGRIHPAAAIRETWLPVGMGYLLHKLIGNGLGINRMLKRHGIPVGL